MAEQENIQRLSEVEYCLERYFHTHLVPVMDRKRSELQEAQAKEIASYNSSFSGIVRSMANAANNVPDDTLQYLRMTGKECSKTAEDYVETCIAEITGDRVLQADLGRLAGEWRNAIVAETGRERYDELSEKIGADLALAYVDYRMEQMMIDRMVAQQMPKSSFEYILRKGASGSLYGLANEVMKSPLQTEIDRHGEAAYRPSGMEKAAAQGVSALSDIVALGGVYSWGALARIGTTEVAFMGLESVLEKNKTGDNTTVEQCISQAVFGSESNVFPAIREQGRNIRTYENAYVQSVNRNLARPVPMLTQKPVWNLDQLSPAKGMGNPFPWAVPLPFTTAGGNKEREEKYADVPLIVAPGHEQEYLDKKARMEKEEAEKALQAETKDADNRPAEEQGNEGNRQLTDNVQPDSNRDGWENLLQSFGLDGLGDIGRNLPYVIAMLPDMLVGLLTGKTQSVGLKKDLIPLASILLGLFVKNPLLKMVLIGMGGANLLNKVGHEAIGRRQEGQTETVQYKRYADEELNPRIVNPVVRGNTLVATIDHIPCSVTLPSPAAQAYATGALPLNTLANAILDRHDRMRQAAQENYRNVEIETGINRERGIGIR